jgi:hypothetical protein
MPAIPCTCNDFAASLGNVSFGSSISVASGVNAIALTGTPASLLARGDDPGLWAGNLLRPGIKLAGTATNGLVQEIQFSRWDGPGWRYGAISGAVTDPTNNTVGDLIFSTRLSQAEGALNERMRITAYGRLGIGTFNPDAYLSRAHIATYALDHRALTLETSGTQNAISLLRGGFEVAAIRKAPNEPLIVYSAATGGTAPTLAGFRFGGGQLAAEMGVSAQNDDAADSPGNSAAPPLRVVNTFDAAGRVADVLFGKTATTRYASISGIMANNTVNTTGHLAFATRTNPTDPTLVERMRITNDGRIGIGTTLPSAQLSLGGGAGNTKLAIWDPESDHTQLFGLGVGNSDFRLHVSTTNDRFSFYPSPGATVPIMAVLGTGTVGIGTTAPSARLAVAGADLNNTPGLGSGAAIHVVNTDAVVAGRVAEVQFGCAPTTRYAAVSGILENSAANTSGHIALATRASTGDPNLTERLRVTSGGNVGVGTTVPTKRLDISGTEANTTPGAATSAAVRITNTDGGAGRLAELQFGQGAAPYAAISGLLWDGNNNTRGHLVFSTRPTGTDANLTEKMRLDHNGWLGIGTQNPTVSLDVAGKGRFIGRLDVDPDGSGAAEISAAQVTASDISFNGKIFYPGPRGIDITWVDWQGCYYA